MKRVYKTVFVCWALVFIISCDKNTDETYEIYNTLENIVNIDFFKYGVISDESIQVSGIGILKTKTVSKFSNHFGSFMKADSVRIIFDGNRVQIFSFTTDFNEEGSILDENNYLLEGGNFVYKITQENYDNATPCDGDCD
ncbi:hypothetical protein ACIGCP_10540 [Cellulophaga baltica]|uniref:hypothetical protein n=1 Tax=Cellulophaga baltica TaxID=76594 RepID=UPI0037C8F605